MFTLSGGRKGRGKKKKGVGNPKNRRGILLAKEKRNGK